MKRTAFAIGVLVFLLGLGIRPAAFGQKPPASSSVFLQRIEGLIKDDNLAAAIVFLRAELKKNPKNLELWLKLGETCEQEGTLSNALEAYRAALALKPGDEAIIETLTHIGVLLNPLGKRKEKRLPTTDEEKKAAVFFDQALKHRQAGRLAEALKNFTDCVALDPHYLAGKDQGLCRLGADFYAQRISQGHPEGRYFHAVFLDYLGNHQAARAEMNLFLERNPGSALVESSRAFISRIDGLATETVLLTDLPAGPVTATETALPTASGTGNDLTASSTGNASPSAAAAGPTPEEIASITILQGKEMEKGMLQQLKIGGNDQQKKALEWLVKNRITSEEAIKTLSDCLGIWEPELQFLALDAFKKMGPAAAPAFGTIEDLTRSDNQALRVKAIETLAKGRISPDNSIPALISLLGDADFTVANAAMKGLAEFGEEALPLLFETRNSNDQNVQEKGAMAVNLIANKTHPQAPPVNQPPPGTVEKEP